MPFNFAGVGSAHSIVFYLNTIHISYFILVSVNWWIGRFCGSESLANTINAFDMFSVGSLRSNVQIRSKFAHAQAHLMRGRMNTSLDTHG